MLKTVVIFLLVYLAIRFIIKVVQTRRAVMDMKQKIEDQFRAQSGYEREEGEVTIEGRSGAGSNATDQGDFVDFEEVD